MTSNKIKGTYDNGYRRLTLEDVAGSIRKDISYWAIDESGNPSRKRTEDGKAFTVAAVTELSRINYDRLLNGVPRYDGEVHFSKLRNDYPEICFRFMSNLGREDIRLVYKTVKKKSVDKNRTRHVPINELYLFSLLNEILNAIEQIDYSNLIIVTYDDNTNIREEICYLLWSERCILVLGKSDESNLAQIADACASSIGRGNLSYDISETVYFDKIRARSVDISNELASCRSSWRSPVTDDSKHHRYKNASIEKESDNKDESVRSRNEKCNRITSSTQHQSFVSALKKKLSEHMRETHQEEVIA